MKKRLSQTLSTMTMTYMFWDMTKTVNKLQEHTYSKKSVHLRNITTNQSTVVLMNRLIFIKELDEYESVH